MLHKNKSWSFLRDLYFLIYRRFSCTKAFITQIWKFSQSCYFLKPFFEHFMDVYFGVYLLVIIFHMLLQNDLFFGLEITMWTLQILCLEMPFHDVSIDSRLMRRHKVTVWTLHQLIGLVGVSHVIGQSGFLVGLEVAIVALVIHFRLNNLSLFKTRNIHKFLVLNKERFRQSLLKTWT